MTSPAEPRRPVRLRRYTPSDASWYAETARDPEIQRFTSDASDLSAEAVERAITSSEADPNREAFLICGADDSDRLGNFAIELADGVAELSYWVAPDARGHGIATSAIELGCAWLESHSEAQRAVLWAVSDNVASRKSAERAGFRLTRLSKRQLRGRTVQAAEYEMPLSRTTATQHSSNAR